MCSSSYEEKYRGNCSIQEWPQVFVSCDQIARIIFSSCACVYSQISYIGQSRKLSVIEQWNYLQVLQVIEAETVQSIRSGEYFQNLNSFIMCQCAFDLRQFKAHFVSVTFKRRREYTFLNYTCIYIEQLTFLLVTVACIEYYTIIMIIARTA